MLKNYMKEGQKLPMFGVGPYIVYGMAVISAIGIILFGYVFKIGSLKGIYSWVRNPMYSGWWIAIAGITLMWHNAWMLILPVINWGIMTVALIHTEEKWLLDLYGDEYAEYKKSVNRCIPWKGRSSSTEAK